MLLSATPVPTAARPLSGTEIRGALSRLVCGATFRASPRLVTMLRFVVERSLEGDGQRLKGYTIAVEAFGRGADFDPQIDPIVRVEAGRLRQRLERYYAAEGACETVMIELPRGGYVPTFRWREPVPYLAAALARYESGGDAFDAATRALIELCRKRLQALAAEVAVVEAMIEQTRAPLPTPRGGRHVR
jgi:hypothetical protein